MLCSFANKPGRSQKHAVLAMSQQAFCLPLKEKVIGLYLQFCLRRGKNFFPSPNDDFLKYNLRFLQCGQLCKNCFFKIIATTTPLFLFLTVKEVRGCSQEGLKEVCSLSPTPLLSISYLFLHKFISKNHKAPGVSATCLKAGKLLREQNVCNLNMEAMGH